MATVSTFSTSQLSKATRLSPERILQLEQAGVISKEGRDRWPALDTLCRLIWHYRDEARRGVRGAADGELRKARALEIELRVAERARRLIEIDEAVASVQKIVGLVRTVMGGIAARVTRDLVLRRTIEKAVNEGLALVVSMLREEMAALRSGEAAAPQVERAADEVVPAGSNGAH
jgi:hypothetical protein